MNTQVIANVAALSTDQLRAALVRNGCKPRKDADRVALIALAKSKHLWDYRGNVVPLKYKAKYGKSQSCGDGVAQELVCPKGTGHDDHRIFLRDVADANGVQFDRWAHCNFGQQIMNLGNVLRGKIKRGEYVIIGTSEWNIENA